MLLATQVSFDFWRDGDYSTALSQVENAVDAVFAENDIGYLLGVQAGAWDVDWHSGGYTDEEIEHLSQCGFDCFLFDRNTDVEKLIADKLASIGFEMLGATRESVEYEDYWINEICSWTGESRNEVVDNLINAGYIDEYDRDYYLDE